MTVSVRRQVALNQFEMLLLLHLLLFIVMAANTKTRDTLSVAWNRIDPEKYFPFSQWKVWAQLERWFQIGFDDNGRAALKRAQKGFRLQKMIQLVRATEPSEPFLFDDLWARVDEAEPTLSPVYDDPDTALRCVSILEAQMEPPGDLSSYGKWQFHLFGEISDLTARAPEQPGPVSAEWLAEQKLRRIEQF